MRQIVKVYQHITGDIRLNKDTVTVEQQINNDLKKNPCWSVRILKYKPDGHSCMVVYDIEFVPGYVILEDGTCEAVPFASLCEDGTTAKKQ